MRYIIWPAQHQLWKRLACIPVSFIVITVLLAGSSLAQNTPQESPQDRQQKRQIIARGQYHYQRYCSVCHGEQGKGEGPVREYLKTKPADLTRLRHNNNGRFPFWHVYQTIDGRQAVNGHGSREMPLWGDEIRIDEQALQSPSQEDLVAGRIWQLILYVESLQDK